VTVRKLSTSPNTTLTLSTLPFELGVYGVVNLNSPHLGTQTLLQCAPKMCSQPCLRILHSIVLRMSYDYMECPGRW
jgi:hypothetical protein